MNEQAMKMIGEISEKLGTTAEHIWGVLLRQAYIDSITNILSLLLGFVVCSVVWMIFGFLFVEQNNPENRVGCEFVLVCVGVVSGIFSIVLVLALVIGIGPIINGFVNPDFVAFNYILNNIKGVVK
jgi:hypothetical protein